ncbi:hypothetical protein RJ640_005477 [Escallonia rubra]|uniref:non-specific serine/threonine protein kinase n=1 Tax=Escallonia rubra TaxID=112253 RepID=A0AA88RWX3_9ASTE|nr:hypothetical protein RJ640_005477 [Escallonia rubra]
MDNPTLSFWFLTILDFLLSLTTPTSVLIFNNCSDTGNYTTNSTYAANLEKLLSSIPTSSHLNSAGFFNSSIGQIPDQVYAIALCAGYLEVASCHSCLNDAVQAITQECSNQKEAIRWYDNCILRFSNRNILGSMDDGFVTLRYNVQNATTQFNDVLQILLSDLRRKAPADGVRKYADGSYKSDWTIYAMEQCTPDISELDCGKCLDSATEDLLRYCSGRLRQLCPNQKEAIVYYDDCMVRYSNRSIFGIYLVNVACAPHVVQLNQALISLLEKLQASEATALCSMDSLEGYELQVDQDDSGEMQYFMLTTIQVATNGFSIENKLGEGGFGPVYRGKLDDGKEIAVKRLSKNSGQGLAEFKTEVRLIVKLQHKNLVRLLGCCIEGDEKLLVYEYMANTSLDAFLFDPIKCGELDWPKRANIVDGIAKGLRYLHEDSRLKTIHRDMKVSNVLLDDEMNAKISDFGTARIFGSKYAMEGLFSTKSDVYSFGVMMLEIISGQRNRGFCRAEHDENLVSYAWRVWKEGEGQLLIDQNLVESCPLTEALRWINIALLCVQENPTDRPTMSSVCCPDISGQRCYECLNGTGGYCNGRLGVNPVHPPYGILNFHAWRPTEKPTPTIRPSILDTGNYTHDSAYSSNLDDVIYSLSTNTTSFSSFSAGSDPDSVSGIALCRGDINQDVCRRCVDDSTRRLRQLCTDQKEAIGWYDDCMVRYSDRSIYQSLETSPYSYVVSDHTAPDVGTFNKALRTLLGSLQYEAAQGGSALKFASGNAWRLWKEGKGRQLIDEKLGDNCTVSEALRWINIALLCVQEDPQERPAMSWIVFMLGGQLTSLPQPSEPPFSVGRLSIYNIPSISEEDILPSDKTSTTTSSLFKE